MLLSIIFIIVGFYCLFTKKPGYFVRDNDDNVLNEELYGHYVQKVGLVYISLGTLIVSVNFLDDLWYLPTWILLFIVFCLASPLFYYYQSLNKRYFGKSIPSSKENN